MSYDNADKMIDTIGLAHLIEQRIMIGAPVTTEQSNAAYDAVNANPNVYHMVHDAITTGDWDEVDCWIDHTVI